MPTTNKTKLRTATAAVDDPGGGDGVGFWIHIEALHRDCTGILDLEQNQVDEDVLCEVKRGSFFIGSLDGLDYNVLDRMISVVISQGGDHEHGEAYAQIGARPTTVFEYVYYGENIQTATLHGGHNQRLRQIIARGSGYVNVEWEWDDSDEDLDEDPEDSSSDFSSDFFSDFFSDFSSDDDSEDDN